LHLLSFIMSFESHLPAWRHHGRIRGSLGARPPSRPCRGQRWASCRSSLVRSCARPPFALDRIEGLADGRVASLLKVPRGGRTHRVMTPMEFMARLAMLIPPPKIPTVRSHGVFAPRSSSRARVTPKPPASSATSTTNSSLTQGGTAFPLPKLSRFYRCGHRLGTVPHRNSSVPDDG
jgi:hypothetical protein